MRRPTLRQLRPFVLSVLAAIGATATLASPAAALTRAQCDSYISQYQDRGYTGSGTTYATRCLLSRQRGSNGLPGLVINSTLYTSAKSHAQESVASKFWDPTNGLVSHLNPGTVVPGDPNALQTLANQQIDGRIRGAGYCAGGASYSDGEITYGGSGSVRTPRAAVKWWMADPPHRAAILNPQFKDYGVGIVYGSAFPGVTGNAATYVVDFGSCG